MQKWSCGRCGRIMKEITPCENCSKEEIHDLVVPAEINEHLPSRVTEVLDSSQFGRKKTKDIDTEIEEFAIQSKAEEQAFFDSKAAQKGDIFEETSLEDNVEATLLLQKKFFKEKENTEQKEQTSPTIFIPTDSEIRKAFGEPPINTTDETFIHGVPSEENIVSQMKASGSLPHVGGSALASTRSQDDTPSHFQHSDVIGSVFGRCRVLEKISEGAMGRVYKAYHQTLDKMVVLKELPPSLASSHELRERFIREAKACARIHHQNVVQVLDAGYENGVYFYIMEYVDGATLEEILRSKKKFSIERITSIIRDAAKGLEVAHREGVVHRDIKASNIMVTKSGEVKVADFGLACDLSNSKISVAGQIMGTPQYMSPEQWDGANNVDERSDLYSLGITLYYFLAGRLPFDSGSTVTLFKQHVSEKPPALKNLNRDVPLALIKIVNRLMEKDREKRYFDAKSLIKDLDQFINNEHKETSSRRRVMMIAMLILFCMGSFYCYQKQYFSFAWQKINEAFDVEQVAQNNNNENQTQNIENPNNTHENNSNSNNSSANNGTDVIVEKDPKNNSETTDNSNTGHDDTNSKTENENSNNKTSDIPTDTTDTETAATDTSQKNPEDTKVEVVVEKEIILPQIQIATKKELYNTFPVVIMGNIVGDLTKEMKIGLILQKNDRNYKKLKVRIKGNQFISVVDKVEDAKYSVLPYVVHKSQKKRIGKMCDFTIDSHAPEIKVINPGKEQIFYEEQGNTVDVNISVQDFSPLSNPYITYNGIQTEMKEKQKSHYTAKVKLVYGKHNATISSSDKAENTSEITLRWIFVPTDMVRIPKGTIYLYDRQVSFETFYVDKKEVTNQKYASYLEKSRAQAPPRWEKDGNDWHEKPVVFVNYDEAKAYAKFNQKRLLTETEWIIAALWTQDALRKYPWGEEEEVAWPQKVATVANWQKDISHFGVYDMAANISEWVEDVEGDKAVRKGGNFTLDSRYLKRLTWDKTRLLEHKSSRKNWLGFRCAFSE